MHELADRLLDPARDLPDKVFGSRKLVEGRSYPGRWVWEGEREREREREMRLLKKNLYVLRYPSVVASYYIICTVWASVASRTLRFSLARRPQTPPGWHP